MAHGHANSFAVGGSYSLSGSAPSLTGSAPTLTGSAPTLTDPGHGHGINATQNSGRQGGSTGTLFDKWIDATALRSANGNYTGITISGGSYTIAGGSYSLAGGSYSLVGSAPSISGAVTNYPSANTVSANMPPAIIMNYIIKA
jgi:hypothetical protein